jgi:hypothetical protein
MVGASDSIDPPLASDIENPLKRWLLLTGRRMSVTLGLMTAVFLAILVIAALEPGGMYELLSETDAAKQLFTALLSGAILLVSIVVSINSVVLSQEITDLEQQEQRIQAALDYHRHVEQYIEADVTPARPADFLTAVLYGISRQVEDLREIVGAGSNDALAADVDELVEEISADVLQARRQLDAAEWGTFEVLLGGLNYDYSGQLHGVRGLKHEHADSLTEEERAAIDDVVDVLTHLGTSREYFKSLYYKREMAFLSSRLLMVGLPVIVFTSYVILALDAALFPEVSAFRITPLAFSVALAFTIALAPFAVLTSYVLRATAVTLRTLAAGPFILQDTPDTAAMGWDDADQTRDWSTVGGHRDLSEEIDDD